MSIHHDNEQPETGAPAAAPEDSTADEHKRAAARRRFLRMGAAGSTAFVVTVVHQRAFAGAKKQTVASNCASIRGIPDLIKGKEKKALEVSAAFGTMKNMVCRPAKADGTIDFINDKNKPPGNCTVTGTQQSKFVDINREKKFLLAPNGLNDGCGGTRDSYLTVWRADTPANNYRLYEKGYCPIIFDKNAGTISYDTAARYYELDGDGKLKDPNGKACQFGY